MTLEKQRVTYNEVVGKLLKECSNKSGYIGVEYDNIYADQLEHEDDSFTNILFFRILREMEYLKYSGHEVVADEYDQDLPFKGEYHVGLHIKRLKKFIIKYADKYLNEDQAKYHKKEAGAY